MTVSEARTVRPASLKYNVQWGFKSNHSSVMNVSDVLAMHSKKWLIIRNMHLAQELAASQNKIAVLKKASKRQQKIKVVLPQVKTWLEAGMQSISNARDNYARAMSLLQDIMTPERDLTFTSSGDTDELNTRQDQKPPLHPQGRLCQKYGNPTVIHDENESVAKSPCPSPKMTALDQEVGQSPAFTPLTNILYDEESSDHHPLEPLTTSAIELTLVAAATLALDEGTAILEKQSIILEPSANKSELNEHTIHSVSSARNEEAGDIHPAEGSPSDPKQVRVRPQPLKSVGNAVDSGSLKTQRKSSQSARAHNLRKIPIREPLGSSVPEAAQGTPEECEASINVSVLSSMGSLDDAFLETSSLIAAKPSPFIPEKSPATSAGEGCPQTAKTDNKRSPNKSYPSTGLAGLGRTSRVNSGASEGKDTKRARKPRDAAVQGPSSAASTQTPSKAEKAKPSSAELQTPRPMSGPNTADTEDDSVPRYASGRPARRSSLAKNYKEPSLNTRIRRK